MKYSLIVISFLTWSFTAHAAGLSVGTGITATGVQCTSVVAGAGASPQTATCPAGYWITGQVCTDATAASVAQPTITPGLGGAAICTAAAGNVTATAICCK